jgi:hypothetical protein
MSPRDALGVIVLVLSGVYLLARLLVLLGILERRR